MKTDDRKRGMQTSDYAEQIEAHRSLLGALGNAIVPEVASRIISAMIQAEGETP